jgi:hypothetical protein
MVRNFIILGQSIIIGVLTLTLIFAVYSYHAAKSDRDDWANFIISAYVECEYDCTNCIDRFSWTYRPYKNAESEGGFNGLDYNGTK